MLTITRTSYVRVVDHGAIADHVFAKLRLDGWPANLDRIVIDGGDRPTAHLIRSDFNRLTRKHEDGKATVTAEFVWSEVTPDIEARKTRTANAASQE